MKSRTKFVSVGVCFLLLLYSAAYCSVDMMIAAHETDSARIDSLERQLPFLEAKIASTLRDGASAPVSFDGQIQVRSQFHNYSGLADSSYLYLTRQGFQLNGDNPLLRVGMVVSPGRNTAFWATVGLNATFAGYNTYQFLKPKPQGKTYDESWYFDAQHHSSGAAGRGITVYEDLSAGIAIRTRPASFMLKLGSMNWMEASPLSIWAATGKAFAWEYLAYEEEKPIGDYYSNKIADLEQVGRGVWNKKPFQGVDFSVVDLPWGLRGFFLYGVGNPFDMTQRYHMDMATDLGYAGDGGSIVESGIGDSYRKFIFYRLSKRLENRDITIGINNGYMRSNEDVAYSGFVFGATFNQKFDIGRYGSEWKNTATGGKTIKLLSKSELDTVVSWGNNREIISLGEGFLVEPNVFSLDVKGSAGRNFSFGFDVGASWVDTHYIKIDPSSYDYIDNDPTSNIYSDEGGEETRYNQGRILDKRIETSSPDIAVYANATYDFKRIQTSLELFYAGENFYSPYSMVNSTDAFWAFGSNMLGTQAFQNMEKAEYSKNLRSIKLTLTPKTPSWHGHLKFGYQLNTQNKEARDILVLPYRLNGATFQSTLNHWYNKWGLGVITEGYDFMNNQGGGGNAESLAKHPQIRFGDQSYTAPTAPHVGGLRSDFDALSEVFVPFETPQQVIFNYFSGSTVIDSYRDLTSIWHSGSEHFGERNAFEFGFNDVIENGIKSANGGKGIKVTDKNGKVSYYTVENVRKNDKGYLVADLMVNGVKKDVVPVTSNTGFVPVSTKKSFDFNVDWALNIAKYIGYKNNLYLSLYYQINGVTRNFAPLAFKSDGDNDVLLVSHYIRSEPTIGITKRFYITTLFGFEKWQSGKTWIGEYQYDSGDNNKGGLLASAGGDGDNDNYKPYKLTGIKQSELEVNDLALGIGFDWDMLKRVSLHGRYKWLKHSDVNLPFNDYTGNVVSLELKAFF